jgi:branched-chain amino acid transport system permease protein
MSKQLKHRLGTVAVVVALLLLPRVVQERYFLHIVVMAGIYTIMTMSWNLLAGYTGQLNLGHAAFFGSAPIQAPLWP